VEKQGFPHRFSQLLARGYSSEERVSWRLAASGIITGKLVALRNWDACDVVANSAHARPRTGGAGVPQRYKENTHVPLLFSVAQGIFFMASEFYVERVERRVLLLYSVFL
jgi:hypothetical protein